jgi:hypothetical protein
VHFGCKKGVKKDVSGHFRAGKEMRVFGDNPLELLQFVWRA